MHQARLLLRVPTHRKVASLLEGEYVALHPGRSTEFADLREYIRGDDTKDVDWKASARARTLLVRRYDALRKLSVVLVVSTGRSMTAGSTVQVTKRDVAGAVGGLLGHLVVGHGDLLGAVHGNAEAQVVVKPRSGAAHAERVVRAAVEATSVDAAPSDLNALLQRVVRSVRARAVVVVVADPVAVDPEVMASLRRIRVRHEVLLVLVRDLDPFDPAVPADHDVVDVDTGSVLPDWLRDDARLREDHRTTTADLRRELDAALDRLGVVHVEVAGLDAVVPAVRELLERHRRARRR